MSETPINAADREAPQDGIERLCEDMGCTCAECVAKLAAHDCELAAKTLRDAVAEIRPKHLMPTEIWEELNERANAILASATPDKQIRHVCGAAGYGHPNDVCPACEAEDKSRATPSGEKGSE